MAIIALIYGRNFLPVNIKHFSSKSDEQRRSLSLMIFFEKSTVLCREE
jgi:hypothetical protein